MVSVSYKILQTFMRELNISFGSLPHRLSQWIFDAEPADISVIPDM